MFVIFVAPYFNDSARRFLGGLISLDGVRVGVIGHEVQEVLPESLRGRLAGHWRVHDALQSDQLTWAAGELSRRHGPIFRLLAVNEQVQVPLAEARERLGIEGMSADTARNFRDEARMKALFRAAGVPCARSCLVTNEAQARQFAEDTGFPLVIKPVDGAATQSTYRIENAAALRDVLRASEPSPHRPLQLEEFVTGDEHSFETVSLNGRHLWHSLTHYHPTPLEVMRNPWIQWRIILPREVDAPGYDDIREIGRRALDAVGMQTGLSHLEWFRRRDGSIAISEVAARPPGARIVDLMNRAHDVDLYRAWAELMVFGRFEPPTERKYAAGVAFLRGLGSGRVESVHGLDEVLHELGALVTDMQRPQIGQPAGTTYEGEGFVLMRHPHTDVVVEALTRIVSTVRVKLIS